MRTTLLRMLLFVSLALLPVNVHAADFGFSGFEVRGGAIFPSDWDTGYAVGVAANVGELTDGLFLYPAVIWSRSEESETMFGVDLDLEITSLAVGAEVRYFPAGDPSGWYFGGGPYVHFLEAEAAATVRSPFPIVVTVSDETEEVGATGVAGYRFGDGRSAFFVEGRYSVVTDFNAAQILVGFSF